MQQPTIEQFLDRRAANAYGIKHHHLLKVLCEVFSTRLQLFALYTPELPEAERFRADLALALTDEPDEQPSVAERWAHFLKSRAVVFEFWSGFFATLGALFGIAGAIFTLGSQATRQSSPFLMLFSFLCLASVFILAKFFIERKALWFKFVVSHLEAIAKRGANISLGADTQPQVAASRRLLRAGQR